MATETLFPTAIEADNLTGTVADIDEDPASPDANWLLNSGALSDCRVSFATPTGNLTGTQTFRCYLRKNTTGGNNCGVTIEAWESGALLATVTTATITSATGQLVSGTWTTTPADITGAGIEFRVIQTSGNGGSPANKRYVDVGAVAWDVTYSAVTIVDAGTVTATATANAVAFAVSLAVSAISAVASAGPVTYAVALAAGTVSATATAQGVTAVTGVTVDAGTVAAVTTAQGVTYAVALDTGTVAAVALSQGVTYAVSLDAGTVSATAAAYNATVDAGVTVDAGTVSAVAAAQGVTYAKNLPVATITRTPTAYPVAAGSPVPAIELASAGFMFHLFGGSYSNLSGALPLPSWITHAWEADALAALLSDGDPVSSWTEPVSGVTLTQATPAKRPVFRIDAEGPYIDFDGVDDFLSVAWGVSNPQPNTVILAMRPTGYQVSQGFVDGHASATTQRHLFLTNAIGDLTMYAGAYYTRTPSWPIRTIQGVFSTTTSKFRIDGVDFPTVTSPGIQPSGGVTLGALYSGTNAYEMDFLGLYYALGHAASLAERDGMDAYLSAKGWGPP